MCIHICCGFIVCHCCPVCYRKLARGHRASREWNGHLVASVPIYIFVDILCNYIYIYIERERDIHVYIYIYICIHIQSHLIVDVCMYVYAYIYIYTHMSVCVYKFARQKSTPQKSSWMFRDMFQQRFTCQWYFFQRKPVVATLSPRVGTRGQGG